MNKYAFAAFIGICLYVIAIAYMAGAVLTAAHHP